MSAEAIRVSGRRPPRAMFLHQLRSEQLVFWRSREAAFFIFLFPLLLYVLLSSVYSGRIYGVPAPEALLAGGLALWHRRRVEAGVWAFGLVAYGSFLAWHASEVARRMTEADVSRSDWLCFGGLKFDLVTARMSEFFYAAPGWVVAFYLSLSLLGLAGWRGQRGTLAAGTVFGFLAAFSIVGNPYNGYWGLLYVPILAFGAVRAPAALVDLYRAVARAPASLLQQT